MFTSNKIRSASFFKIDEKLLKIRLIFICGMSLGRCVNLSKYIDNSLSRSRNDKLITFNLVNDLCKISVNILVYIILN